jgi:hypothetical protein
LTYSHGHFGPVFMGSLRNTLPSPLQSNWRTYVGQVFGKTPVNPTVLFIKNIFSSSLYAAGTRIFSDALPSHLAKSFVHQKKGNGYETVIEPGAGSAPGFTCDAQPTSIKSLPPELDPFFSSWDAAMASLCLQESAIAQAATTNHIAQAEIDLPIPLKDIIPLTPVIYIPGTLLKSLGADAMPFCFCVPAVKFKVLGEKLL